MCSCGCGTCNDKPKAPILNENVAPSSILSEGLKYHVKNNKPLVEQTYRAGSTSYFNLWSEARALYSRGIIDVSNDDLEIISETNLGEFGIYEGIKVPLDFPIIQEGLIDHSQYELQQAGLFGADSDYNGMIGKAVLELIKTFSSQGHSGFSAQWVKELFNKLSNFENLTPITPNPEEWTNVSDIPSEPLWQNKRNPATFSKDGGKTWYNLDDKSIKESIKQALTQHKQIISESKKHPALNKPHRGGAGGKKYVVYVKDPKTKRIKKISFGDSGGLREKINDPKARYAFAKRHRCSEKKDKTTAGYWSCRLPRYAHLLGLKTTFTGYW
jgi:hypothetical protein